MGGRWAQPPLLPLSSRKPWVWPWFGHVAAAFAVLAAGAVVLGTPADRSGAHLEAFSVGMALSLVAVAVLLVRRRLPAVALVGTVLLVVISVLVGAFTAGPVVAVAIALNTYVQYIPRRSALPVTVGVAVVVAICGYFGQGLYPHHVLTVLLGAAFGVAARSQRAELAQARERAERAEATRDAIARSRVAEARLAIARDLHDVVGHQMAVIALHAGVAANALPDRTADAARSLGIVQSAASGVIQEIGELLASLRDSESIPNAEVEAPVGIGQLDGLIASLEIHGLTVTQRLVGSPRALAATVNLTASRVIGEALTNAHKYSADGRAHLLLQYGDSDLSATVTNRIGSPNPDSPGTGSGFGIIGMRERVTAIGGTITAGETSPGIWEVNMSLPTSVEDGLSEWMGDQ